MMFDMMPSEPLPAMTFSTLRSNSRASTSRKLQAAIGIEVQAGQCARHGLDGFGRRAERILVGGEFGDVREAVLLADGFDGAAGFVGAERFDIWRD